MFYVLIVAIIVIIVAMVLDNYPETKEKVVSWLKDTIKWVAICAVVVAAFFMMVYFSMPAKAEELPEGFYYKVVFIDDVEEVELDRFDIEEHAVEKFLIHTDDLDHLWDYWDVITEDEEEFVNYEFDRELSNIAAYFISENGLEFELNKEERITRGRIVVLTMWECDPEDPFDEEVWDVYYSEFITW